MVIDLPGQQTRSPIPTLMKRDENDTAATTDYPQLLPKRNLSKLETRPIIPPSHRNKSCRLRVNHTYHDHCHGHSPGQDKILSCDEESESPGDEKPKGGVATPFPLKLHLMLDNANAEMFEDIVSWQPHGRCFKVHEPKKFVEIVMPRWFNQSRFTSFQRQLNLYGFCRLTTGPDRGGYYHELFLCGHIQLCKSIFRTCVKGTGVKAAASPSTEPNFYKMEPCLPNFNLPSEADDTEDADLDLADIRSSCSSLEESEMGSFWLIPELENLLTSRASNAPPAPFDNAICNNGSPMLNDAVPAITNSLSPTSVVSGNEPPSYGEWNAHQNSTLWLPDFEQRYNDYGMQLLDERHFHRSSPDLFEW